MGEKSLSLMIKTLSHLSQMLLGMFFSSKRYTPCLKGMECCGTIIASYWGNDLPGFVPRALSKISLKDKKTNKPAAPDFKNSQVQMDK